MEKFLHIFRHKWSKWKRSDITGVKLLGNTIHKNVEFGQQRICSTCGKVQWEEL